MMHVKKYGAANMWITDFVCILKHLHLKNYKSETQTNNLSFANYLDYWRY